MLTINKFVRGKISLFHTKNCSSENSWQETFHWRYLPKNDSENNVFTGIDRRFHSWQTSLRDIIFYCYSPILFTPEFQDCCIIHSANDDRCFGFEETLTFVSLLAFHAQLLSLYVAMLKTYCICWFIVFIFLQTH